MAGTSGVATGRGALRMVMVLGIAALACLFGIATGVALPTAHADTPRPPATSTPTDEPVGGGARTLTWLALGGAAAVALVAGGVVVLAGRRRTIAVAAAGTEEPQAAQEPDDSDGSDPDFLDVVLRAPSEADEPGVEDDEADEVRAEERQEAPEEDDSEEVPDEDEAAPRRALAVSPDVSADAEADPDAEPTGRRRAIDLDTCHLDDPLALDAGVRPRRALQPVPDSATTVAPTEDDTSWADWYESAQDTMRRGRRALPSDPDGESTPRRARH